MPADTVPEISITEFADAIRGQLRAEMRVHRTRMNTALREFKDEVGEKIDEHAESQERVEAQLSELVVAVTALVQKDQAETAARERRVTVIRRGWRLVNTAPGAIATVTGTAGAIAGAIAFF